MRQTTGAPLHSNSAFPRFLEVGEINKCEDKAKVHHATDQQPTFVTNLLFLSSQKFPEGSKDSSAYYLPFMIVVILHAKKYLPEQQATSTYLPTYLPNYFCCVGRHPILDMLRKRSSK